MHPLNQLKRIRNETQFYNNNVIMSNLYLNVLFTDHNEQYLSYQNIKYNWRTPYRFKIKFTRQNWFRIVTINTIKYISTQGFHIF